MAAQVYYSPFIPAFSPNGLPVPGAFLTFYYSQTETKAPVYLDDSLTVPALNPVQADLAARFPTIYLDESIVYRVRLTDSSGTPLGSDIDPYIPGEALKGDTGPANSTFTNLTALRGAALSNRSYNFAPDSSDTSGFPAGLYFYRPGNYSGPEYANDFLTGAKVKLDAVPLTTGVLVRQQASGIAYKDPMSIAPTRDLDKVVKELPVTPQSLGAKGDGVTSDHLAFLALSSTSRDMIVPPGDYLIDNSVIRQISFYTGEIRFAPGARLVFTDSTKKGLFFYKGSPRVHGVTLTTKNDPSIVGRQDDAAMLRFDETINAICSDVVIERGAGAGILVREGIGFAGSNISIENTLADGFDFFNHAQGRLTNLRTFNTGDDGLGCVSYRLRSPGVNAPQGYGLNLTNIQVRRSRTRGISFVGYKDSILTNFLIDETQGDGMIIERDDAADTHTPSGIRVSDGIIQRGGKLIIDAGYTGEKHGLKIGQSGSVFIQSVDIIDSYQRGVSATSSETNAHAYFGDVYVEKTGQEGFGFSAHRSIAYGVITAQDTAKTGIYASGVTRLVGECRIVIRGSMLGAPYRAVWDQNNSFQDPGRTVIEDLIGPATGFIYRVEGTGRGSVGRVEWNQSGAYYTEFLAPYMLIPSRVAAKRDEISPGTGNILLSPYDAWQRKIYDPLTSDITVGLPLFGMAHGDEVSVARYDGTGTFTIGFRDRNNSDTLVTSIPPGTPMINRVRWDAVNQRWRAAGKTNL